MTTQIRNTQINPFANKRKGRIPDELQEVEFGRDKALERILKVYQQIDSDDEYKKRQRVLSRLKRKILTPSQIDIFLQKIIDKTTFEKINSQLTGEFLSRLIQYSYNKGYNGFVLHAQDTQIPNLGYELKGRDENRLEVCIKGYGGYHCGQQSKQSIFTIEGDVGQNCGDNSEQSTFNIEGDAKRECGYQSKQSTFHIGGNVRGRCGNESKEGIFHIKGDAPEWCGSFAENGVFNIKGDVGYSCGIMSKQSTFTIGGNVGYECGYFAQECIFTIEQNVGYLCGGGAKQSTFTIGGDVGGECGRSSEESSFNIGGDVGMKCGHLSKQGTFRSSNIDTFIKISDSVPQDSLVLYKRK